MKFNKFVECIKLNPTLNITVNHNKIDEYITSDFEITPKEVRRVLKQDLNNGLALDDLLSILSYHFLPKDLIKIFSEGEFYLK